MIDIRALQRLEELIADGFTRIFVRVYYGSEVRKDIVESYSGEQDVYWMASSTDALGQTTPIGTIILNEEQLADSSEAEVMQVLEHEVGHRDRMPLARGVFWGCVLLAAMGIYFLLQAIVYSFFIPYGVPPGPVAQLAGVSLLFILLGWAAVRTEEIFADFHVLQYVSYEEFLSTYEEMRDTDNKSLVGKMQLLLIYTDPRTIVRLHQMFNKTRNRLFVL